MFKSTFTKKSSQQNVELISYRKLQEEELEKPPPNQSSNEPSVDTGKQQENKKCEDCNVPNKEKKRRRKI